MLSVLFLVLTAYPFIFPIPGTVLHPVPELSKYNSPLLKIPNHVSHVKIIKFYLHSRRKINQIINRRCRIRCFLNHCLDFPLTHRAAYDFYNDLGKSHPNFSLAGSYSIQSTPPVGAGFLLLDHICLLRL